MFGYTVSVSVREAVVCCVVVLLLCLVTLLVSPFRKQLADYLPASLLPPPTKSRKRSIGAVSTIHSIYMCTCVCVLLCKPMSGP